MALCKKEENIDFHKSYKRINNLIHLLGDTKEK
jgi:hypothetical protein